VRDFYMVNEVFYSLQGEGVRAGTPNVFIRFSGCNLECRSDNEAGFDCDTEFESGTRMGLPELGEAIAAACADSLGLPPRPPGAVILTGGEPGLQVDAKLIGWLRDLGMFVAIETNGTKELPPGIDWICCSPKSAEHTLRLKHAHELKYVRHRGQGIPRPSVTADHYLISPAFDSITVPSGNEAGVGAAYRTIHRPATGAMEWCIQLVKENPTWRLSVQQHKSWAIR